MDSKLRTLGRNDFTANSNSKKQDETLLLNFNPCLVVEMIDNLTNIIRQ